MGITERKGAALENTNIVAVRTFFLSAKKTKDFSEDFDLTNEE